MFSLSKLGTTFANTAGIGSSKRKTKKKPRYAIYRNGRKVGNSYTKKAARNRVKGKRGMSFRKIR